jgi:hypothetical protein
MGCVKLEAQASDQSSAHERFFRKITFTKLFSDNLDFFYIS